jgi:hypothetical protein
MPLLMAGLFVVALMPVAAERGARGEAPPQPSVPPVSMTCPMHPDVVETSPGDCPICKMKLVPVRLEAVWTCPVHAVIAEDHAGFCPIDHRALIQVTVAVTFTCTSHPEINQIERGTCPDGTPMTTMRTLRPHGNHNPQHGGLFFMAPDNTHHLEGVYPRAQVFRLYLYDDYARPLPPDQIRGVKARVVTKETFETTTRSTKEIAAFPLVKAGVGYLEARIETTSLPAQMSAKVQFKSDAPEYRFDFTFPELSRIPVAPAAASSRTPVKSKPAGRAPVTAAARLANPADAGAPSATAPAATELAAGNDPSQDPGSIPGTVNEILANLKTRNEQVGELVQRGAFGALWVPAFQARDLAIALEAHLGELPAAGRDAAEPAIQRLVRTAWLLDAFGDIGNRQQIVEAYSIFTSAVTDVVSALSGKP